MYLFDYSLIIDRIMYVMLIEIVLFLFDVISIIEILMCKC